MSDASPAKEALATRKLAAPSWWPWGVVALVGAFLLATIKPGQGWDGDGELFILNALNILQGGGYAVTNYQVNPTDALHPAAYPPGLPMLLAPVIALTGLNYLAMKTVITACFVGLLAVMVKIAKPRLPGVWLFLLVLALGLNPFVGHFKDTVFSEFPFMLAAYFGLFAFDRLDRATGQGPVNGQPWPWAAAAGLAIGAAYEVRAIGLVLFAAVAVTSVRRLSRLGGYGLVVLLLAAAESALISHWFPADLGTYAAYFKGGATGVPPDPLATLAALAKAGGVYLRALGENLAGGDDWTPLQACSVAVALAAAALGLASAAFSRLGVFEVFSLGYLGALLVYPVSEEPVRYALPLLPFLILYGLEGARGWSWLEREGARATVVALVLVALYLPQYMAEESPPEILVDDAEAVELFQRIRRLVPNDALILCFKPTIVALHTARRSTNPPRDATPEQFERFIEQTRAGWLVELKTPDSGWVPRLSALLPGRSQAVFANAAFTLYRMLPPPRPPAAKRPSPAG